MIYKIVIALLLGAGLLACSAVNTITVDGESIGVTEVYADNNDIDSMVTPYRSEMESRMSEVIAYSLNDFTRGRPGGSLNNWSADVILSHQKQSYPKNEPVFSLLNYGGLRNPIGKGEVTLEDIYKLMPFDNEIVLVEMPLTSILDIESYLIKSGGEPIAGATLENGKIKLDGITSDTKSYWIVTSDYLMNGGDKMVFFEKRISEYLTGDLMRDVMIEQAKKQDTLVWNNEIRINL
jgi:2',3'-cyclic-nucleotide 2'-phosphodiesterase (5'-nucleotidase family)